MSDILGGIFTSHVPGIGVAIARGLQDDPYWKPFFDGFKPIHRWLAQHKPDIAVVFYNDHGLNFFLDKMPTFAVGAARDYRHEDEGWGITGFKPFSGAPELSWHIIEEVVASEFDPVTCQQMLIDHAVRCPSSCAGPTQMPGQFGSFLSASTPFSTHFPVPSVAPLWAGRLAERCKAGQATRKSWSSAPGASRISSTVNGPDSLMSTTTSSALIT